MFKNILVPTTGAETDTVVFATALSVARLAAGHLIFLHVQADLQRNLVAMLNSTNLGGTIDYRSTVAELERHAAGRCRKAEQMFRDCCEWEQLTVPGYPTLAHPSAEWKLETGDEAACLAECGRTADLVVTGRVREGETVAVDLLEACLMATGRPVLIAPTAAPGRLTGTVAIAWKNSLESARAVAAAQPFIEAAERVIIFSVEEGIELAQQSGKELRNALSWHNPNTSLQRLGQDDVAPVETLLNAVNAADADLLVMGGYSHSRLREMIFGGFTRRVLNGANLPVLMAH